MIAEKNIQSLIPQRPPFVMVDRLVFCDEKIARIQVPGHKGKYFCV